MLDGKDRQRRTLSTPERTVTTSATLERTLPINTLLLYAPRNTIHLICTRFTQCVIQHLDLRWPRALDTRLIRQGSHSLAWLTCDCVIARVRTKLAVCGPIAVSDQSLLLDQSKWLGYYKGGRNPGNNNIIFARKKTTASTGNVEERVDSDSKTKTKSGNECSPMKLATSEAFHRGRAARAARLVSPINPTCRDGLSHVVSLNGVSLFRCLDGLFVGWGSFLMMGTFWRRQPVLIQRSHIPLVTSPDFRDCAFLRTRCPEA
jgi:hypothetical protein